MNYLYIKIHKINSSKTSNRILKPNLLINLIPTNFSEKIKFNKDTEPFSGKIITILLPNDFNKFKIEFSLLETFLFQSDSIYGSVTIPLEWFPINKVIKEWFPIEPISPQDLTLNILIEVHITTYGHSAFNATSGNLLIIPLWKPFDDTSSTIPKVLPIDQIF